MEKILVIISLLLTFIFIACTPITDIKLSEYPVIINKSVVNIDEECKLYYKRGKIKILVLPNNYSNKVDVIASQEVSSIVSNISGLSLYSNKNIMKYISRLKDKDIYKVAKKHSIRYVILVKSLGVKVSQHKNIGKSIAVGSSIGGITKAFGASSGVAIGVGTASGLLLGGLKFRYTASLNLELLDTKTREILNSKILEGVFVTNGRVFKKPNTKSNANIAYINAARSSKAVLTKYFKLYGYIIQARVNSDKSRQLVMVNLGSKNKLKEGDRYSIFSTEVIKDPISGKKFCNLSPIDIEAYVTNIINRNYSWMVFDSSKILDINRGLILEKK